MTTPPPLNPATAHVAGEMARAELAGNDDNVRQTDSADLVARAEAALEGVTDGPWGYIESQSPCGQEWLGCGVVDDDDEFVWFEDDPDIDIPRTRFIAAARDLVPDLTAALRAAEERAQRAEAQLDLSDAGFDAGWRAAIDAAAGMAEADMKRYAASVYDQSTVKEFRYGDESYHQKAARCYTAGDILAAIRALTPPRKGGAE